MAQLSRPYQIGLAAVLVLGLLWFVALRPHPPGADAPGPAAAVHPAGPAAAKVQAQRPFPRRHQGRPGQRR